jgi:hypothetical protein
MQISNTVISAAFGLPLLILLMAFVLVLSMAAPPEPEPETRPLSGQDVSRGVSSPSQSLALNLTGFRVATATIEDMDVGNDPTVAFTLRMYSSDPTGNPAQIGKLIIDGVTCTTMSFNNVDVYEGLITQNTFDGASYSASITSTVSDVVLASSRGAQDVGPYSGSTMDRIWIQVDGMEADVFTLKDIRTDGPCEFIGLTVGEIDHRNSQVGDGSGIGSASWVWSATSTKIGALVSYTDNIDDLPFQVR